MTPANHQLSRRESSSTRRAGPLASLATFALATSTLAQPRYAGTRLHDGQVRSFLLTPIAQ